MEQVEKNSQAATLYFRGDGRVIVEWVSRGKRKQKSFSGSYARIKAEKELSRRNGTSEVAKATAKTAAKPAARAARKLNVTSKNHKTKSDTLAGELGTMQDALSEVLSPPAHIPLTDEERPFWESIMRARARSTWNDFDLEQAAILAKTKADIVRLTQEIRDEGEITRQLSSAKFSDSGEIIASTAIYRMGPNPKRQMVATLNQNARAIARAIHVDATSTQGRGRDTGEKTKRERQMRDSLTDMDDDALIPGLSSIQ